MTVFFVSDTHFGHRNIIKYCNRPFTDVEEMDEAMVAAWNKTVKKKDVVYHLGDVAFYRPEVVQRLKGVKYLVPGNHDHDYLAKFGDAFEVLPELYHLKVNDVALALCHYPLESWRPGYKYHLHGHAHGASQQRRNRMDVGVDATGVLAPISLDEVLARLTTFNEGFVDVPK